jgi:hypothetical protein
MIDKNAPHQLCSDRKEVCPVLPMRAFLINEPEIYFIDKRCSLQGVTGTFAPHVLVGQPAQFLINQRHQFLQRCLVPVAPVEE